MDNRRKSRLPSLGPKATDQSITDFSTKASHNSSIYQSAVRPLNRKSTLKFGGNQSQNIPGSLRKSVAITPIRSSIKRPGQPLSKLALSNNFSASTPRVPGLGQGYGNNSIFDKENNGSLFQPRTPNNRKGLSFNQTLNSSRYSNGNCGRNDFNLQDVPSKTDLKDTDVQQDQVSQILNFVKLHGYTKDCSVKDFCPPNSASTYYSVWEFLVTMIDPKFSWEPAKDTSNAMSARKPPMANQRKGPNRVKKEEVIVEYIKMTGYPHVIPSKSVFNTISQKSSWPPLLSILIYHKKLAEFSINTKETLHIESQQQSDEHKIDFLRNTWLKTNMAEYGSVDDCHIEYKQNRISAQTEQMGTMEELEDKHDNLKADIREIEIEKNNLRETNIELQTIRTEVDNHKIQAGKISKELTEKKANLHKVETMNPKKEMEEMSVKLFEAEEKLSAQGEPKSKLNAILNRNNSKIQELKEEEHNKNEQFLELQNNGNVIGKILHGKLQDLKTNCRYEQALWSDEFENPDLNKLGDILGEDIMKSETRIKQLNESVGKLKNKLQTEQEEFDKARKQWKTVAERLEWLKQHVKSMKDKKEEDVEEQLRTIQDKEKSMYSEVKSF